MKKKMFCVYWVLPILKQHILAVILLLSIRYSKKGLKYKYSEYIFYHRLDLGWGG